MFTARSIPGLSPMQGLDGLAALGTLVSLPADFAASFGRVARRYPASGLLFAAPIAAPAASAVAAPTAAALAASAMQALRALPRRAAAAAARLGRHGLPATVVHVAARTLAALALAAERLGEHLARRREQRLTEHALRQLDSRTLRDIGLTPCEITSAAAEAAGTVEATRLRAWREIGARVY